MTQGDHSVAYFDIILFRVENGRNEWPTHRLGDSIA
jgi:hypothetical protein